MKYEVSFWKPNRDNKGSAAFFSFDNTSENQNIFFSMMPQNGGDENERKFDRDRRITMSLGLTDVGAIIATLNGRTQGLGDKRDNGWSGLYHKNNSGFSSMGLSEKENGGYWLSLSVDKNGNKSRLVMGLTLGEAEQLLAFMRTTIAFMFEDRFVGGGSQQTSNSRPASNTNKTATPSKSSSSKPTNTNAPKTTSRQPVEEPVEEPEDIPI